MSLTIYNIVFAKKVFGEIYDIIKISRFFARFCQ